MGSQCLFGRLGVGGGDQKVYLLDCGVAGGGGDLPQLNHIKSNRSIMTYSGSGGKRPNDV